MTLLPASQDCRCVTSGANNAMWNWNDLMEEGTMTRSVVGNDKSWEAGSSVIVRRDSHLRWMSRSSSMMIVQISQVCEDFKFLPSEFHAHHFTILWITNTRSEAISEKSGPDLLWLESRTKWIQHHLIPKSWIHEASNLSGSWSKSNRVIYKLDNLIGYTSQRRRFWLIWANDTQ